jgi:endo-1,3-1,4-beta-glycanase ExoK
MHLLLDRPRIPTPASRLRRCLLVPLAALLFGAAPALAQDEAPKAFVENFDKLDLGRWYVSDGWNNGKFQNCTWSKDDVKAANGVLTITFNKRTLKDRDYSCGELQTKARYGYGVYEARLRSPAASGVNSAFFTYIGPAQKKPHDEIDFEILTKDPGKVQLNSYVNGVGKNEKLVDVPGGADQGFNDYAFVWEEGRIRWYVNGELVHTLDDPAKVPTNPSKIFFSLWGSDTFKEWLGPFADPGKSLVMEVDRVAFTPLGEACQFPESVACKLQ